MEKGVESDTPRLAVPGGCRVRESGEIKEEKEWRIERMRTGKWKAELWVELDQLCVEVRVGF